MGVILMSQAQAVPAVLPVERRPLVRTSAEVASIPWTIWFMLTGTSLGVVGAAMDVAWHMSIGRDTYWTPGHMLIQMESVLVGIGSVYTILSTTFGGGSREREASVGVLGFRAPGGAFIAAWGAVAMLASAPFDNWWHNAYGLDAKLVTPPHMLLALGSLAMKTGVMAWMASIINRSQEAVQGRLRWLLLMVGGLCVAQFAVMSSGLTFLRNMHSARCYLGIALTIPSVMIATGWGSARKWGCTIATGVSTGIALAGEWLLPLFPAQPKLGPVYHNVTHLVPFGFPLLLIVPAFVADLLLQRLGQRSSWKKAVWVGPAFVLSFLAVQWPFANFLMSPASRNWIFGTGYFAFGDPAGVLYEAYKFNVVEKTLGEFILTMAAALVVSIVTTRVGLAWGDWMRRVRR
jgi:hypothetical protein